MMENEERSLGELEELYNRQIQEWAAKRREHEKEIERCQREIQARRAKLRHVEALLGKSGTQTANGAPETPEEKERRRRLAPVKIATWRALRHRPGKRLTTRELLAAIHEDIGKWVSRQSVNVNLGVLEKEGRVQKHPAPRSSGARFVYEAVPGA